jgi:Fur family peroxide stress response transcriptional regulator
MKRDMLAMCKNKSMEFEAVCKKNGLALTIQRRVILESLASRTDHPTADQVYEDVADKIKGVSRTTVYRVLETFVSIGLAKKISNPESKARFDADTTRHHHLTCTNCGVVLDLFDNDLNNLRLPTGIEKEFEITDYSITFTGMCSVCGSRRKKTEM